MYKAAPNDSRYVPFTQQAYCCAPTSIQMIMYRHRIPLIPAEELGYHLGLVVSPDEKALFYDVRTANDPPSAAGFGTQIYNPEYEPNKVFQKLGIPLEFTLRPAADIGSEAELVEVRSEERRV